MFIPHPDQGQCRTLNSINQHIEATYLESCAQGVYATYSAWRPGEIVPWLENDPAENGPFTGYATDAIILRLSQTRRTPPA